MPFKGGCHFVYSTGKGDEGTYRAFLEVGSGPLEVIGPICMLGSAFLVAFHSHLCLFKCFGAKKVASMLNSVGAACHRVAVP